VRHPASHRVDGAIVGLSVVAVAAVFALIVFTGLPRASKAVHKQQTLNDLSAEQLMVLLGEYDVKVPDCAGLVQGMTGYAYPKVNPVTGGLDRVVIVCKP
jgi:hypothetical protein